MKPEETAETVFISYSHDSAEHVEAVLNLSNRLRSEGIDCVLDQYEASPPEGWPKWMDREIRKAKYILMICTEGYYNRVMGLETPGVGHGIAWEGSLIYQHIYDAGSHNVKFIPIIFKNEDSAYIPTPAKGASRYCLDTNAGYENLYTRLLGLPPAQKPPLGARRSLPARKVKTNLAMFLSMAVDPELWDKAGWRSTVFLYSGSQSHGEIQPPMLGLGFADEESAKKIFKGWHDRYGKDDPYEELRISIIEGDIPGLGAGYSVHVGSEVENVARRYREMGLMRDGDLVTTVDRVNRMNAPSSSGLADFKARYRKANSYFLVPVLVNKQGTNVIKPMTDLYIHKSKIHFRSVNDIGDNDQDIVVFPEKSR